jgi:hypothetical protein
MFFVSAALLAVLVALQVGTHVTQQWFESVHPLEEYAARLVAQGAWLRAIVAVDDVFITAYTSAVVLLALVVKERGSGLWVLVLVAGAAGGLLDFEENHHLLAMLTAVERGGHLEASSLEHRMLFSSLKWLVGPVAYCFFALGLSPRTRAERVVQLYVWLWFLPLTAVVLAVDDPSWVRPLALVRLVSVLFGFVSLALVLRARGSGAQASSPGTTRDAALRRDQAAAELPRAAPPTAHAQ